VSICTNAPLVLLVAARARVLKSCADWVPGGGSRRVAVRRPAPDASGTSMEAGMSGKDAIEPEAGDHDVRETLATIQDQGWQMLDCCER